jgi:hypothetical protein
MPPAKKLKRARLSVEALLSRQERGKPPTGAVVYDRKDMTAITPAERIKPNPAVVDIDSVSQHMHAAAAVDWLEVANSSVRKGRRQKYRAKLNQFPNARKMVSEGDSWHLLPLPNVQDIINQLNGDPRLAIFSTDGAGDTLDEIWSERLESNKGFQKSLASERPSHFLVCGGGNDLLQGRKQADGSVIGNLYFYLRPYQSGMSAADLILPSIKGEYDKAEGKLRSIVSTALAFSFVRKIILHGYSYPFPKNDTWLGKPMAKRGIVVPSLQRDICKLLMDKLHERLVAIRTDFSSSGRITYVDVREAVPDKSEWFDEIHPNTAGFKRVTSLIKAVL